MIAMPALEAPLRPLATLAWGMLLVAFDFRVGHVDLVPDPIGWVLGAVAARSLAKSVGELQPQTRRWFGAACVTCAVAVLPSIADWVGVQQLVLNLVLSPAETIVLFTTCTGIMAVLPARSATANALRWFGLGAAVALAALAGGATGLTELAPLAFLAGLTALVVFVCFLVLLFRAAKEPLATY